MIWKTIKQIAFTPRHSMFDTLMLMGLILLLHEARWRDAALVTIALFVVPFLLTDRRK